MVMVQKGSLSFCTQEHSSSLRLILHSYHAVPSSIQIACCFSIVTTIKQATHFEHFKDVTDHAILNSQKERNAAPEIPY